MNTNQDYISYKKVLLFGDKTTGKSSLIYRFEKGEFSDSISPTEESKTIIYIIIIKIYYSIKISSIRTRIKIKRRRIS